MSRSPVEWTGSPGCDVPASAVAVATADPAEAARLWVEGTTTAMTVAEAGVLSGSLEPGALVGGTLIAALMIAAAWRVMPWLEAQKGESGWP